MFLPISLHSLELILVRLETRIAVISTATLAAFVAPFRVRGCAALGTPVLDAGRGCHTAACVTHARLLLRHAAVELPACLSLTLSEHDQADGGAPAGWYRVRLKTLVPGRGKTRKRSLPTRQVLPGAHCKVPWRHRRPFPLSFFSVREERAWPNLVEFVEGQRGGEARSRCLTPDATRRGPGGPAVLLGGVCGGLGSALGCE